MDALHGVEEAPRRPALGRPVPAVGEPFLRFYAHYGETLCGPPVSDVLVENGRRCQYFEHLALEEADGDAVRLKPLGRTWLEARRASEPPSPALRPEPRILDMIAALPRHPRRTYPERPLESIRYLVLHHTGASRDVDAGAIAEEHVVVNDWPGIGYHFVIDPSGAICQTQDLCTASYHARQFNPAAVGIALIGDLSAALPSAEQLSAAVELCARLLLDLGLPISSVRGHREMVPTPCPGDTFLSVWKPRLLRGVADRLAGRPAPAETEPEAPTHAAVEPEPLPQAEPADARVEAVEMAPPGEGRAQEDTGAERKDTAGADAESP